MSKSIRLYPSILAAGLGCVSSVVSRLESQSVDGIHVDVMDGQFVKDITFGANMVEAIRQSSSVYIDVHLMTEKPLQAARRLVDAGADSLTFHRERLPSPLHRRSELLALGVDLGLAINPCTGFSLIKNSLEIFNRIVVMAVEPGACGQAFDHRVLKKISEAADFAETEGLSLEIVVDGGVNPETLCQAFDCGATSFVVGSYLFKEKEGIEVALDRLKNAIN